MIKNIARRSLAPLVLWDVLSYKEEKNRLPVLFYHRVNDDNPDDYMSVTTKNFRKQMELLKKYSFKTISLNDAHKFLSGQRELPARSILITFDDGFKDNYTNAFPILRELRFEATVFLRAQKIAKDRDYLDWYEIKDMYAEGISFGSHTLTHPNLDRLSEDAVKDELIISKSLLEIELKREVDFLCYPKGRFNDSVKRLAKEAGYKAAFSILPGYNTRHTDPYEIRRIQIGNKDRLIDFKGKLLGTYMPLQKYYYARSIIDDIRSSFLEKKHINVLYVIWSLGLGGAEQVVINLSKGLDRSRFNPIICCLNDKGEFADELKDKGITVIALDKKGKFDISIIGKIMSVIKRNDIDIVHTHLWGANLWGRIAARLCKVPVVVTEHNEDVWKPKWFLFVDRILSLFTDRIIAVSSKVKDFYVEKAGIRPEKITVVYNGIDFKKYGRESAAPPAAARNDEGRGIDRAADGTSVRGQEAAPTFGESDIVLGVIGRLVPQKGHTYFLNVLNRLSSRYDVKGLIVGSGPLEEELKAYSKQIGLGNKVIFTGLRHDVPELLKMIDILVMPSSREGLPIVALEAMACGVPVVATDVGGNPEVVIDGETGIIVPARDTEALEKAIHTLIMDRDYYQYLSNNSRTRIRRHFDVSIMVKNTVKVYEEILARDDDGGYEKNGDVVRRREAAPTFRKMTPRLGAAASVPAMKFIEKVW